MGSQKVSFQSQVFNMSAETGEAVEETVMRLTGPPQAVMGMGGWSGDILQATGDVADLRGKELGHVHSVLFWNQVAGGQIKLFARRKRTVKFYHNSEFV